MLTAYALLFGSSYQDWHVEILLLLQADQTEPFRKLDSTAGGNAFAVGLFLEPKQPKEHVLVLVLVCIWQVRLGC